MYKKEPIKGYEEYQIDTNGIVYTKKGHPMKYSLNHNGYCIINLSIHNKIKGFGIHTLVAKQFISNDKPLEKTQVNHKDGNKQNNNVDNLEWVTPKENVRHCIDVLGEHLGAKNPNAKKIKGIDKNTHEEKYVFDSIVDGAKYFCKDGENYRYIQHSIWRVLKGMRKTYKNCYWEYIN